MLSLAGRPQRFCDGVSRRTFLQIGALGLGGLTLPDLLGATKDRTSAKSIVMVYLPGGPTQFETVDPKPEAPVEIRGACRPIETNVSGIQFCELLPKLARMTDRLAVLRSIVGSKNRHESFFCYTGRHSGRPAEGDEEPSGGWPSIGAVVSKLLGPGANRMPPFVDAAPKMSYGPYNNNGQHDFGNIISWPGFLGHPHTPFHVEGPGKEDLVLDSISSRRLIERKTLLDAFDRFRSDVDASGVFSGLDASRQQALDILTSNRLAMALDLEREDPRVRERYGPATPTSVGFGGAAIDPQRLLLTRRLIEAGVRCVTVALGAWDWHGNRGGPVEKISREYLPSFDHSLSVFIQDLDERGLLDDVMIVVWGEFGRTPRINAKGGRDHWPQVSPAIMAGGGMRTGQVVGVTDPQGGEAIERPVHMQEVLATLYHHVGIDVASTTVNDLSGRPHYLVDEGRGPIEELI